MKPSNFPAKVERRFLRAQQPKNEKTEPTFQELESYRSVRTKKVKVGKRK